MALRRTLLAPGVDIHTFASIVESRIACSELHPGKAKHHKGELP
jgi:hypothetical protein